MCVHLLVKKTELHKGMFETCEHPVHVYSLPTSEHNNQAQQVKHCVLQIDKSRAMLSLYEITR